MWEIVVNLHNLEPRMKTVLYGLVLLVFVYALKMPALLQRAYASDLHRQSRTITLQNQSEGIMETTEAPLPAKKRNSLSRELYYKSFGIVLIVIAAIIRYVIKLHPEKIKYSEMMEVHLTMGLIILGAWIFGATRNKPRGPFTDGLVNLLFIIWTILLFN